VKKVTTILTNTGMGEHRKELSNEYGNISSASVGAIQRRLLILEEQGAEHLFGEPALRLEDLMITDFSGNGVVSIMDVTQLIHDSPRVYASFLIWLMAELFEQLPEVGNPEKPVMVLFFDEALRGWHPPTRQRMIVDRNYMLASELDPLGRSVDYAALTRELSSRLRKRSVLFLIGDFMEMPDLTALSALHEVNCLIVRDSLDEELPAGEFTAVDAGTLAQRELTIEAATRRRYRRIIREHDSRLSEDFRRRGIRWQ